MPGIYISKILFADDTVVLNSNKNLNIFVNTVNVVIFTEWMNYDKLVVDANTTKCMLFSSRE